MIYFFPFPSTVDVSAKGQLTLSASERPKRTTLPATLSSIFPIELSSPPDLLYTILDASLPCVKRPAPISLAAHKEVTEEATALGYVSQVLHMLAAYLGKASIYL
jgi:hypothetical protein